MLLISDSPKTPITEIVIDSNSTAIHKTIVDLEFPRNAIIAMIKRNDNYITPKGSTVIEKDDTLIILSDNQEDLNKAIDCLTR